MLSSRLASSLLLCGVSVWCLLILLAPLFHVTPIYALFSVICHQQPSRSWHIGGEPLAVCIRCASIYFGALAGLLTLRSPGVQWLKVAIAATAVEFVFAQLVLDSALLRSMSGLMLGAVAAPFVRAGVTEMLARFAHESM